MPVGPLFASSSRPGGSRRRGTSSGVRASPQQRPVHLGPRERMGSSGRRNEKGATWLRPFGNRTPGNNRYRCFLSDLAGLAARPPSGSLNAEVTMTISVDGASVNRSAAPA